MTEVQHKVVSNMLIQLGLTWQQARKPVKGYNNETTRKLDAVAFTLNNDYGWPGSKISRALSKERTTTNHAIKRFKDQLPIYDDSKQYYELIKLKV